MVDIFTQMSGPVFLGLFLFPSIAAIVIGGIWINADGSTHYHKPELTDLKPFEIAALRDGRKGVIQMALFNLWMHKLLMIKGRGNTVNVRRKAEINWHASGNIEKAIYQFAHTSRKPTEFFTDSTLQKQIDAYINPINQRLEELHLKHTKLKLKRIWVVFWITLFAVLGICSTGLYIGIIVGHRTELLFIFLVVTIVFGFKVLKPTRKTRLGSLYYKRLAKHFEWAKDEHHKEIDSSFRVAVFGITGLVGLDIFDSFRNAFLPVSGPGGSNGGCGGCGGGSGSSGGCGGGG